MPDMLMRGRLSPGGLEAGMFAVGCRGGGAAQQSSAWRCDARRALQMQRESAVTELRRWRKMYRRGYGQAGFASWRRAFLTLSMCEPVKGPRGRSSDDSAIIVVKSLFRQQQQQQRQSVQRRERSAALFVS